MHSELQPMHWVVGTGHLLLALLATLLPSSRRLLLPFGGLGWRAMLPWLPPGLYRAITGSS